MDGWECEYTSATPSDSEWIGELRLVDGWECEYTSATPGASEWMDELRAKALPKGHRAPRAGCPDPLTKGGNPELGMFD